MFVFRVYPGRLLDGVWATHTAIWCIGQVETAEIVHEIPRVIIGELAELSVVNISHQSSVLIHL